MSTHMHLIGTICDSDPPLTTEVEHDGHVVSVYVTDRRNSVSLSISLDEACVLLNQLADAVNALTPMGEAA